MHESPTELAALQDVLDRSYRSGRAHLTAIHAPHARLTAREVVAALPDMQVAVVGTVSSDGRPFTGPVDAFLFRGRFHFGTATSALRARHLRRNPAVSVTCVRGEEIVVTAHGRARALDPERDTAFRDHVRAHYGERWDPWDADAVYFVVEPDRVFAADMRRLRDPD